MSKLFISYSRGDEKFINRLCEDLDAKGVAYWLDVKDIVVGDSIIEKIERGLKESEYFCLCLSKSSVTRDWVIREYRTALTLQLNSKGTKLRIVPFLIDDCEIPPLLLDIRYADFRQNYVLGLNDLLKAIKVNPVTFVPYRKFIRHIESLIPLGAFFSADVPERVANRDDSWCHELFRLLEDGIRDSQAELEEYLNNKIQLKLFKDSHHLNSEKGKHVLISPPIEVYGGYNYINHLDDVEQYTIARTGFHEFLENLIRHREQVLSRALYILPRTFVYEIDSFPDGGERTFLRFEKVLKALKIDTYYTEKTIIRH